MKSRKTLTKKEWLKMGYHVLLIIVGTLFLTFGTVAFLTPYNIVTGGISGIAIAVQNAIFGNGENVKNIVDIVAVSLNIVLFVIGFFFLGKKFSIQTFLSVIIYTASFPLFIRVLHVDQWFNLESGFDSASLDPRFTILLAALCGNSFVGIGVALTFLGGGSTGGVDVLALIANKYFKVKTSVATFFIDASIIIIGFIISKDFVTAIIGVMGAFVSALLIDKIFVGTSESFIATIISDRYEEINQFVIHELDRSTTMINAIGGYSKGDKKMIRVVFGKKEYTQFIDFIRKIDPNAFISIAKAHEIRGEGFTEEKTVVMEKENG